MGKASRRKRQRHEEGNPEQESDRKAKSSPTRQDLPPPKPHKKEETSNTINSVSNPLESKLNEFLASVSPTERDNFFSEAHVNPERRAEIWAQQAEVGESLVNKYAWAIPNERALKILKHFEPLIEVGCGANAYWCKQMQHAEIDIVGYDNNPTSGGKIEQKSKHEKKHAFAAKKGGPEVLAHSSNKGRNLFLCYPDENEISEDQEEDFSLALECLENFQGEYVVHVGEIYGDTLSVDQAPWGRSSSPYFQQHLATMFHCVLQIPLPNWIHVRDTLTVWKRSALCQLVFAGEDEEDESTEEVTYRHIPPNERLPTERVAPCLAQLLEGCEQLNSSKRHGTKSPFPTESRSRVKNGNAKDVLETTRTSKHDEMALESEPNHKDATATERDQGSPLISSKTRKKKRKPGKSEKNVNEVAGPASASKPDTRAPIIDKEKEKEGYQCQW